MSVSKTRRLHIIGAGFAGRALANEVKVKSVLGEVVAFLEDNPELIGKEIDGVPVLGPVHNVAKLIRGKVGDEAVIAMPEASSEYIKKLYGVLKSAGFDRIRILPGISQIINGDIHLIQTRSIDPQDLLGRTPIAVNLKESLFYLRDKRVLVTGAGGSIGSELCRQLLSAGVERLYLFGHGENSIYQIDRELQTLQEEGVGERTDIVTVIGDLKDERYINYIIKNLKADAIFHAAAYKHVPLMEANPVAAIENNLFGTLNLVNAAKRCKVSRFVFVTTDKAVEPVSIYGASKQLCEKIVLKAARETTPEENGGSNFMVVRFGNVLGSRGSIAPLFQTQIERGGPLTVTHPDMRRWFMTIPEACSLVLKAGGVGDNGELYLLDMGEPVRIRDVAEQMIRFYGYEPEIDIKIEYIGCRAGEKLDEKLFADDEIPVRTKFKKISRIRPRFENQKVDFDLDALIEKLRPACYFDERKSDLYRNNLYMRSTLKEAIPTLKL
ncbi:MAG: polysaccharide biosynthesis protein [Spirochaetaceae bacterium]|jgi:FlaA1/EpsC-like NDP-sugar epimerase|nr:polysaccharide biosynthesis protein [Spirochaetaceae bacterium]